MSRVSCCCGLLLLLLAGCAKEQDYLEVQREQLAVWKETTEILQTVKDEQSMTKAMAMLDEKKPKYEALARKANALPKPPPAGAVERMREQEFAVRDAIERLQRESTRVSKLPGGEEFMKHFKSRSQSLMTAVQQ